MTHAHYRLILTTAAGLLLGLSIAVHAQDTDVPPNSLVVDDNGNIGAGVDLPQRQLHLKGFNAVVRLDRSTDAATFMMVRTDSVGNVLKTYSLGTRASGPNQGEFQIADFGQSVGGASERRMTITNSGDAQFTGEVWAPGFVQTSSARYKRDIETLADAGDALKHLRGVRFVWRDSEQASLGLIAEEVAEVYPDLVKTKNGKAEALNYTALVAVLVEAFKEQQSELATYRAKVAAQQIRVADLEERLVEFESLEARLDEIEELLIGTELRTASFSE